MKATCTLAPLALTSLLHVPSTAYDFLRTSATRESQSQSHLALETRKTKYRYYNDKTKPYLIEHLPQVDFDLGEIYSGSIPISEEDPDRTLFFVFKPAINTTSNDLTIWLDGGPGSSSLVGFFQGNGPALWQSGTYEPKRNPYTWALETNMLWVDQPVGTGFSQGKITAKDEKDIAEDFVGFFKNFQLLFGIEQYKIYVTGASYAGRYVPYIAAEMLDQKDTTHFDVSGIFAGDPVIGQYTTVQQQIPRYPFARANNGIVGLDQSTLDAMEQMHKKCRYDEFINKYLTFPPPENQPEEPAIDYDCQIDNIWIRAAIQKSPCFNSFHITDSCPNKGDVIYGPDFVGCAPHNCYFNRTDVKRAIHAPLNISWTANSERQVFKGGPLAGPEGEGDLSPDPIQHVLPKVIEATNRVVVANGNWDGVILTNGTLLSIQNMTWHGHLGFQEEPSARFVCNITDRVYDTGAQGNMGTKHCERGLCWVALDQAGHQINNDQPRASLQMLRYLIGKIDHL